MKLLFDASCTIFDNMQKLALILEKTHFTMFDLNLLIDTHSHEQTVRKFTVSLVIISTLKQRVSGFRLISPQMNCLVHNETRTRPHKTQQNAIKICNRQT
jgi:hypothetical protein